MERFVADHVVVTQEALRPLKPCLSVKPLLCGAIWMEGARRVIVNGAEALDKVAQLIGRGGFTSTRDSLAANVTGEGSGLTVGTLVDIRTSVI
jgi:hypothetical protein